MNRELADQPANRFATTHWSLVLEAGDAQSPEVSRALEQLCQTYWQPLYWHVRRLGYESATAQDLTQAFVAHLLEKRLIAAADRERGKFRTFLLTALRNFLANDYARQTAVKRGGGRVFSMDFCAAEQAFRPELMHAATPETAFERQWAVAVLEEAFSALARQQNTATSGLLFEVLSPCLTANDDAPRYVELAEELGMSVGAIKKAVSRLRAQYARAIRAEVAKTIAMGDSVDDEIKNLFRAVRAF